MNETIQELSKKLNELDTSQNAIEACSKEFLEIVKSDESRMEDLAKLWKSSCFKTNKLPGLYLVNDIIQNSSFQKLTFHEKLFQHIVDIFPRVYHTSNNKIKVEIQRLIEIWTDRKVYPEENLIHLKQMLYTLPNIDNINNFQIILIIYYYYINHKMLKNITIINTTSSNNNSIIFFYIEIISSYLIF